MYITLNYCHSTYPDAGAHCDPVPELWWLSSQRSNDCKHTRSIKKKKILHSLRIFFYITHASICLQDNYVNKINVSARI